MKSKEMEEQIEIKVSPRGEGTVMGRDSAVQGKAGLFVSDVNFKQL